MSGCWDIDSLRINAEQYLVGRMHDEELDAMMADLFAYGRDDTKDQAGPVIALSMWEASDWGEDEYREAVKRFKDKWFKRTPKNRVEFYQGKLQEYCDKLKAEMTGEYKAEE